jgi:hypothetical protein
LAWVFAFAGIAASDLKTVWVAVWSTIVLIICVSDGYLVYLRTHSGAPPKLVLPIIAADCRMASLPGKMPPNGLNYLDFTYSLNDGDGGPIGTGGFAKQPGESIAWATDRIGFPIMYCELTTKYIRELYSVRFNLHVTFSKAIQRPNGQIDSGETVKERQWPVEIARISDTYSFGFYSYTTSNYLVYARFSAAAQYFDAEDNTQRDARLLVVNTQALSFVPAYALKPKQASP